MNIEALNRGFVNYFERNAPFDFFAFYPGYVNHYDYERDLEGHIVDVDTSIALTHTAIRAFVQDLIADPVRYEEIVAAYTDQLPNSKVYDLGTRKVVVRHMRGQWTTAGSMKDFGMYLNSPVDLVNNRYIAWVGGYQRNRVYYGDLIVAVARTGIGPSVRNESILPIHIVQGLTFPNRINATGLLLEDWVEYREEYTELDWVDTELSLGGTSTPGSSDVILTIRNAIDPNRYRLCWTNDDTLELEYTYFTTYIAQDGELGITPLGDRAFSQTESASIVVQEYRPCQVNNDTDEY